MKKTLFLILLFLFFCGNSSQAQNDSVVNKLVNYVRNVNDFNKYIPQEKVYLHFDNNSYYKGDNIWFKCYVVTSTLHAATTLSKTLYVDLLNPGGEVIEKKVLEIKDGQCSGDFLLNRTIFYSGFYEIRAYTKYMLNFGEEAIFSRVFPVFDAPEEEGDYSEKKMEKYTNKYPMKRKKPQKDKKVNVKFFPEGGNLVENVESRIAFQSTDEYGEPIMVTGAVINDKNEEVSSFASVHEGRGYFSYTPISGKESQKVIIRYNGKEHKMDLPKSMPQGYVMKVDNLSQPDVIDIFIHKNDMTSPDILGVVVMCRGNVNKLSIVDFQKQNSFSLNIPKKELPTGINQVILFNESGEILCDRLVFVGQDNYLNIAGSQNKDVYNPYEQVNMEFLITDKNNNPVSTSFSLSVKDAASSDVSYSDNIQANMLLSSEIKGYIHNPSYYFESDDTEHRQALDLLLMVQGWRRYVWKQMAGLESFNLKYIPEEGVEIRGQILSPVRKKIKPNLDITLALTKIGEDENRQSEYLIGKADSLGQFRLISGLYGKWDMVIGVSEKGKKKKENIVLDRLFRPNSKTYTYPELKISIIDKQDKDVSLSDRDNNANTLMPYLEDSLELRMDQKVHQLKDVTVTAEARNHYRAGSVAYYDVSSELNDIIDDGGFVGEDIYEFLLKTNPHIFREIRGGEFIYTYKGKNLLIVKDRYQYSRNEQTNSVGANRSFDVTDFELFSGFDIAKITRLNAVKSMYISEDYNLMATILRNNDIHEIQRNYGGILFLETYLDSKIPNGAKGVRKLKLEGYSLQKEFYSPDYSILPKEADYRRTLYWNPNVKTDEQGKAKVQFYNNSTCRSMIISAETITSEGVPGVYKSE